MTQFDPFAVFRTWPSDWQNTLAGVRAGTTSKGEFALYWLTMTGLGILMLLLLPIFYTTNTKRCPVCSKPNMDGQPCPSYERTGGCHL